jgi:hypothetical protein
MESVIKTHDGVEVIKGEYGWACYKSGKAALGGKDTPTPTKILYSKIDDDKFLFFSSEPACQSYIDSMNEPKLVTQQIGDAKVTVFAKYEPMSDPMFSNPSVMMPPIPNPDIHSAQTFGTPPRVFDLQVVLHDFSTAYNIPINTVLEFIVNQKSK